MQTLSSGSDGLVSIPALLRRNAKTLASKPAYREKEFGIWQSWSWAETEAEIEKLALGLLNLGVAEGDFIAIIGRNRPYMYWSMVAAQMLGAVPVPLYQDSVAEEMAYVLDHCGARFVIAGDQEQVDKVIEVQEKLNQFEHMVYLDPRGLRKYDHTRLHQYSHIQEQGHAARDELTEELRRRESKLDYDSTCVMLYTSGTTGKPKGVMITHRMLIAMSLCYQTDVDLVQSGDTALYAAPLSHAAGIYNMMHVRAGAAHVCPPSGGFDPVEILDLAAHFGSVHMFAAPTMVQRMTEAAKKAGVKGDGLRTVVYAGGPMYNADIIEAVDHFGPIFAQIYGQGECPMGITALSRHDVTDRSHPRWRERLGSVGRTQSAVEVAIGSSDAAILGPGEHGEIMVRGDTVMPGYWRNPEATEKTLVNGWLMTGDMGVMDADGYVTLRDRSKDLIITGGSNVYPREVEEVLLTHPGIVEASVVGRPHPQWGEEIVAFIVGDATEAELDRLCIESIARFKRPKTYVRLAELPKNNYGKVLKTELRARLAAEAPA